MSGGPISDQTLERYHDGELDDAEVLAFEKQLPADAEATTQLAFLGDLSEGLQRVSAEDAAGFDKEKVWEAIAAELPAQSQGAPWWRWFLGPQGALAGVALALFIGVVGYWPSATSEPINECFVDSVEAGEGDAVVIGQTAGPEPATVIWLVADMGAEEQW